nr:MAG TPA: hypothetical protein [Caudoviricetes sp.]
MQIRNYIQDDSSSLQILLYQCTMQDGISLVRQGF